MKIIEIKNFELSYDGMYFIKWDNHKIRVFLQLNVILKMLDIEGLTYEDVENSIKSWNPIKFSNVTMTVTGEDKKGKLTLLTSDMSDEYLGKTNLTMIDIDLKESE